MVLQSRCTSERTHLHTDVVEMKLDFRSYDDAWYSVGLVLEKETLILKYLNFSEEFDERYSVKDFKNVQELEIFTQRFRPTSAQLQDQDCSKVIEGMKVCASYEFGHNDVRFYDAIVEEVIYADHIYVNGDEVCKCAFVLFWEHGPNVGIKTSTVVEHICLIKHGNAQMEPTLALFLKTSREKLVVASHSSDGVSEGDILMQDISTINIRTLNDAMVAYKSRSPHCDSQASYTEETKRSKKAVSTNRKFKGLNTNKRERTGQDMDLGGKSGSTEKVIEAPNCHFVLIENLEKDLSPPSIVDFVKKHVAVSSQAQVFPSLSSESYTRGIIVVDGQQDLEKLYDFLLNPAHMILSSRGRPWVVTEKKFRCDAVDAAIGSFKTHSESQPCCRNLGIGEKIKVFRWGTEEYKRGKKLRELFMEFADHLRDLHKKLAKEESKILQ